MCICCAALFCHHSFVKLLGPLILTNIIHCPFLKYRSFKFDCCMWNRLQWEEGFQFLESNESWTLWQRWCYPGSMIGLWYACYFFNINIARIADPDIACFDSLPLIKLCFRIIFIPTTHSCSSLSEFSLVPFLDT